MRKLLAMGALALALTLGVTCVPTPAQAFNPHWGPNPYLSVAPSHPFYRSVAVIDNTGDPVYAGHLQTLVQALNNLHNTSRPTWPTFMYYQNIIFAGNDIYPACNKGPNQYIVVCKRNPQDMPLDVASGQRTIGQGGANVVGGGDHLGQGFVWISTASDLRCSEYKWTLMVHEFGHALPLPHNPSSGSAMYTPSLSNCYQYGYDALDVSILDGKYTHAAG